MNQSTRVARLVAVAMLSAVVLLTGTPAAAQSEFGVRAGVSGDPDQFYFGGHLETPPLVDRVRFRPNIEIGLGNSTTLVAFNFEFVYRTALRSRDWDVYAGAGPAANYFDYEATRNRASGIEPGLNFVAGLAHRGGLHVELKLGAIDSPSIKFAVGYAWR